MNTQPRPVIFSPTPTSQANEGTSENVNPGSQDEEVGSSHFRGHDHLNKIGRFTVHTPRSNLTFTLYVPIEDLYIDDEYDVHDPFTAEMLQFATEVENDYFSQSFGTYIPFYDAIS